MNLSDFDYLLPKELIAQEGLSKRDDARLMVIHKDGRREDRFIKDLTQIFREGDLLVLNDTRVLPSKLMGKKESSGKVDCLILPDLNSQGLVSDSSNGVREVILRGSSFRVGTRITFHRVKTSEIKLDREILETEVIEKISGTRFKVRFSHPELIPFFASVPLPPYIKKPIENFDRYQTIYSQKNGSLAAPTAGLHFTPELMKNLKDNGIDFTFLTLHIGIGTFAPIRTEKVQDWKMDSEYYRLTEENARKIEKSLKSGGRIFVVGTSTLRALESASQKSNGKLEAQEGWTKIFIYPGYRFNLPYSGLLTNFHLPKSTLILLASAFSEDPKHPSLSGREKILSAYEEAIKKNYRFYSFGDATLILRDDK